MKIVQHLDRNTTWFAQTTRDIAPVAPESYRVDAIPGKHPSWLFQTAGTLDPAKKLYPGVLFAPGANSKATPLPIPPNSGPVSLRFDMWPDEGVDTANVFESDLLIVTGGFKYNLSGQRHAVSGQIDIGNWTDTGIEAGPMEPNEKCTIRWDYAFDTAKKVCSVRHYAADESIYAIPASLQNMAALPCNWEEGAYIQIQLGSLPSGAPWSMRLGRIRLEWW